MSGVPSLSVSAGDNVGSAVRVTVHALDPPATTLKVGEELSVGTFAV